MPRKRDPRVDRLVRSAIADLLETEIADPRVAFVTITEVEVTPDHEVATLYYSTLDPDLVSQDPRRSAGDRLPDPEDVADGLASATPRLRSMLAGRVKLRMTPELRFRPDQVVGQATRIDRLLRDLESDDARPRTAGSIDPEVYRLPDDDAEER